MKSNLFKRIYDALKIKALYPHNRSKYLKSIIMDNFKKPSIIEIGVFEGDLSYYVFSKLHYESLTLIDPYMIYEGNKDHTEIEELNARYKRVLNLFKKVKNANLCRTTLDEFVNKIYKKKSYDFIYIDGDHSFEGAYSDLINSEKILNRKGLIVLDDYADVSSYGITKAVNKFLGEFTDFYIYDLQHKQLVLKRIE